MNPDTIEHHLLSVVEVFDAAPGDDDYFTTTIGNTPILFGLTSHTSASYMFKLRMLETHDDPSDWHESLSDSFARADIECEIDGDYIFLWIRNAATVAPVALVDLVSACIEDHAEFFPDTVAYCYGCQEAGHATLVSSGNTVSSMCQKCLREQIEEQVDQRELIPQSNAKLAVTLPAALAFSAAGWAAFWIAYYKLSDLAGADGIPIPRIVLFLVTIGLGIALGWPAGTLMRRSRMVTIFPVMLLTICATFLIVLFGESLIGLFLIYNALGTIELSLIPDILLVMLELMNGELVFFKLLFAGVLCAVMNQIATPKEVKLQV